MIKKFLVISLCSLFFSCSTTNNTSMTKESANSKYNESNDSGECTTLFLSEEYEKALPYCEKSANQGDAKSQTNLGIMYHLGRGVPENYQKAIEWYQKAMNKGNTTAQVFLGIMYEKGQGVAKDYQKAKKLYKASCNKGDILGCHYLENLLIKHP